MTGGFIGEDTAEIRAIPIHRCVGKFQRNSGVLIECRFTCIHLRITASEGIRNPEIRRIPDTAAQSIIIISLGYITDFVLGGREQCGITANRNPVTACVTILNLIGQAILDALPIECIEGEGSAATNGDTAVKSLLDVHRADFNVNITVTAIFSLIHAGIYRAAQSVFTLELNTVCGVIQLGITYRACRIRQVTVRCCSERQAVNLAAHSAVRGIEGSARITDFYPIANLVVNGDNAVIPGNIGGFQLFIVIQLTVNRLVDRTFPVLIVFNRVSSRSHQLQRMGLSVVPEMVRYVNCNHAKLSDLVAALIDNIGTHHAGGRQVRDNVLAIAVYNTVIVNAIGAMNNNLVTGIIGHAIRGREQCIQVTNNTGNTGDADIRLVIQLQNRQRTFGHIRTQVPAVVLAAGIHAVCSHACVIKHRLIVACELDLIDICIPVTREVLDRLPAFRQCQVIRQLIAAIQRIPESAASLQSRQNLLCVDGGNTNHKMNVFLAILLCRTNLTLFTLRDIHNSVGKQRSFTVGCLVCRQMTNLVHQEVASTRQVEVTGAKPSTSSFFIDNRFGGRVRVVAKLRTGHVATCIINPDRAKSDLRVGVSLGGSNCSACG